MDQKQLLISQLDRRMALFAGVKGLPMPGEGWIHAIRTALGMSLKQLSKRLGITPQGTKDLERREREGAITLQRLRDAAAALDMQLVYGFVPKEESLDKLIEKRALQLAREIVMDTAHTMHLENQEIDPIALEEAIKKRAEKIKNELPKSLWN
ncbi:MAG: mobile mystery protein A [Saprospiraceae bacterium]|nr:mobile mystery protein A [Saprospiraceae bacterium]